MAGSAKLPFDPKAFNAKYGGATIRKYGENDIIYAQGGVADAVFYLEKGKVRLTVLSEQAKERVVALVGAGEFCGEGCLADQSVRISTATAMTECQIVRLERTTVSCALHEDLSFSEFFASCLLAKNVRLMDDFIDRLFRAFPEKAESGIPIAARI